MPTRRRVLSSRLRLCAETRDGEDHDAAPVGIICASLTRQGQHGGEKETPSMVRAKCARCGATVTVTDISDDGYSFEMMSGRSLSDLCQVAKEQRMSGHPAAETACLNLRRAIRTEIHTRVLAEV
jgi:hypothetical protein